MLLPVVLFFFLGLILGSFINLAVPRLHLGAFPRPADDPPRQDADDLTYDDRPAAVNLIDARSGPIAFPPPYLEDLRSRIRSLDSIAGYSPSWNHALTADKAK